MYLLQPQATLKESLHCAPLKRGTVPGTDLEIYKKLEGWEMFQVKLCTKLTKYIRFKKKRFQSESAIEFFDFLNMNTYFLVLLTWLFSTYMQLCVHYGESFLQFFSCSEGCVEDEYEPRYRKSLKESVDFMKIVDGFQNHLTAHKSKETGRYCS